MNTSDAVLSPARSSRSPFLGVIRADGAYRLVAVRRVLAGSHLFYMEGEVTERPTRYSLQIGANRHIDLNRSHSQEEILDMYYWRFMNHSCEPNSEIRGRDVFALEDIEPWADITFNYNTTEYEMAEPFTCHCGSTRCLGVIRGFMYLNDMQRKELYPFLAPHLAELVNATRANRIE